MKKVHVVFGSTGEYSDRRSWLVRAFHDKRKAEAFAKKCQKLVDDKRFEYCKYEHREWKHPLDPDFVLDYTGTSYYVHEVPFED